MYKKIFIILTLASGIVLSAIQPYKLNIKKSHIKAAKNYSSKSFLGQYNYILSALNVALGRVSFQINETEPDQKLNARIALTAFNHLQKLSGDSIGILFNSTMSKDQLLPESFENNTLYKMKKGKKGQLAIFHHDNLFMTYKNYKEDISADTRDPVSLLVWLMTRNYEEKGLVKSTFRYHRNMYVVVGRVYKDLHQEKDAENNELVCLKLNIIRFEQSHKALNHRSIKILFSKKDGWYLPLKMDINSGILNILLYLE